MLEEHELKLKELRALIDAGHQDVAAGRTTAITDPKAFADDVVSRGRSHTTAKKVLD